MRRPICIDLFCGLGGFTDGFLAEGYRCIGFDVEWHDYGTGGYPGQLVLQDVLTIHGSQFRHAACIVASPPCQEFSYMAMPWKRAKQIARALRGGSTPAFRGSGTRDLTAAFGGHRAKSLGYLHGATFSAHHGGSISGRVNGPKARISLDGVFDLKSILQANDTSAAARNGSSPNDLSRFHADSLPLTVMACQEESDGFPGGYTGSRTIAQLTALFDVCFRIQREASEAAGHHVPLVVENVKGAQPWVGRAKANYGSFYLWGDVESVGGRVVASRAVQFGTPAVKAMRTAAKVPGLANGTFPGGGLAQGYLDRQSGRKVPVNFHEHEKTGKPGRSFQSAEVEALIDEGAGTKQSGISGRRANGKGSAWFEQGIAHLSSGSQGAKNGGDWFGPGDNCSLQRRASSRSPARKAASAQIAKIPLELSRYLARCFRPENAERVA